MWDEDPSILPAPAGPGWPSIILNHQGKPVGIGRHAGRKEEQFPAWRKDMADLADVRGGDRALLGVAAGFGGDRGRGLDRGGLSAAGGTR
jgi:hypothetical protein